MSSPRRTYGSLPAVRGSLLLACLSLAGCATDQALTAQTVSGDLAARQAALEHRLDALEASLRAGELRRQLDALAAKQQADAAAGASADATLAARLGAADQRLGATEQRLKELNGLVQEAVAMAAKEIFLANGKEAYSATLTGDRVLYPLNDPALDSRDRAKLDELAAHLATLDQEYHLDIQGHTDDTSTEDNNYNLGKARAEVVRRYLHERQGIPINRMSTTSYGSSKPLDPMGNHNRRILVRVLVLT